MTISPSAVAMHLEEVGLARYVVRRICDGAAGRLDDECILNAPRDTYFIGSLRPAPAAAPAAPPQRLPIEVLNKIAPTAFGLDIRLVPQVERMQLSVTFTWACYYRV